MGIARKYSPNWYAEQCGLKLVKDNPLSHTVRRRIVDSDGNTLAGVSGHEEAIEYLKPLYETGQLSFL